MREGERGREEVGREKERERENERMGCYVSMLCTDESELCTPMIKGEEDGEIERE